MVHGQRSGGRGGSSEERPSVEGLAGWLSGRLPDEWFESEPTVTVDRDEILIEGRVAAPEASGEGDDIGKAASEVGRISRFREDTREERMAIAREAEHLFGRNIAWGASAGDTTLVFTNLSVPVMTRLRQPQRRVLDTLVDSGVARSRSDALVWCVRLVAEHADEWLEDLRVAMEGVETLRQQGPAMA
jgi:hypothetical protein